MLADHTAVHIVVITGVNELRDDVVGLSATGLHLHQSAAYST